MMSFCRLSTMNNLRMVVQAQQAMSVRGFHMSMDTTRTHHDGNSEILYDMISSGAHSSTERITKFMNTVYVNKPRGVSLFSFNYRQQTERNTIRGVCIGTNNRRGPAQKNVVIAAGLALQDPSLIGVALYLSAVLSRLSPLLPRDVSVIPLANPREYEKRWKASELSSSIMNFDNEDSNSDFSKFSKISRVSRRGSAGELGESEANWFGQENVTLELQDTCKPIETYVTRKNKYFINVEVDLTSQGSTMTYKGNSLSQIANKGKFRDFFINKSSTSSPLSSPSSLSSLFPLSYPLSSSPSSLLIPETSNSLLAPILDAPSIVMELKGNQSLNDEEVVARGEEIISMLRELMAK